MHGASIVALNLYDMLKPIDKGIEIHHIKLIQKHGGKSDYNKDLGQSLSAVVIVCSDTIAAGKKQDAAGKTIINKLEALAVNILDYLVIPDEAALIQEKTKMYVSRGVNLIIFTGGTGL